MARKFREERFTWYIDDVVFEDKKSAGKKKVKVKLMSKDSDGEHNAISE